MNDDDFPFISHPIIYTLREVEDTVANIGKIRCQRRYDENNLSEIYKILISTKSIVKCLEKFKYDRYFNPVKLNKLVHHFDRISSSEDFKKFYILNSAISFCFDVEESKSINSIYLIVDALSLININISFFMMLFIFEFLFIHTDSRPFDFILKSINKFISQKEKLLSYDDKIIVLKSVSRLTKVAYESEIINVCKNDFFKIIEIFIVTYTIPLSESHASILFSLIKQDLNNVCRESIQSYKVISKFLSNNEKNSFFNCFVDNLIKYFDAEHYFDIQYEEGSDKFPIDFDKHISYEDIFNDRDLDITYAPNENFKIFSCVLSHSEKNYVSDIFVGCLKSKRDYEYFNDLLISLLPFLNEKSISSLSDEIGLFFLSHKITNDKEKLLSARYHIINSFFNIEGFELSGFVVRYIDLPEVISDIFEIFTFVLRINNILGHYFPELVKVLKISIQKYAELVQYNDSKNYVDALLSIIRFLRQLLYDDEFSIYFAKSDAFNIVLNLTIKEEIYITIIKVLITTKTDNFAYNKYLSYKLGTCILMGNSNLLLHLMKFLTEYKIQLNLAFLDFLTDTFYRGDFNTEYLILYVKYLTLCSKTYGYSNTITISKVLYNLNGSIKLDALLTLFIGLVKGEYSTELIYDMDICQPYVLKSILSIYKSTEYIVNILESNLHMIEHSSRNSVICHNSGLDLFLIQILKSNHDLSVKQVELIFDIVYAISNISCSYEVVQEFLDLPNFAANETYQNSFDRTLNKLWSSYTSKSSFSEMSDNKSLFSGDENGRHQQHFFFILSRYFNVNNILSLFSSKNGNYLLYADIFAYFIRKSFQKDISFEISKSFYTYSFDIYCKFFDCFLQIDPDHPYFQYVLMLLTSFQLLSSAPLKEAKQIVSHWHSNILSSENYNLMLDFSKWFQDLFKYMYKNDLMCDRDLFNNIVNAFCVLRKIDSDNILALLESLQRENIFSDLKVLTLTHIVYHLIENATIDREVLSLLYRVPYLYQISSIRTCTETLGLVYELQKKDIHESFYVKYLHNFIFSVPLDIINESFFDAFCKYNLSNIDSFGYFLPFLFFMISVNPSLAYFDNMDKVSLLKITDHDFLTLFFGLISVCKVSDTNIHYCKTLLSSFSHLFNPRYIVCVLDIIDVFFECDISKILIWLLHDLSESQNIQAVSDIIFAKIFTRVNKSHSKCLLHKLNHIPEKKLTLTFDDYKHFYFSSDGANIDVIFGVDSNYICLYDQFLDSIKFNDSKKEMLMNKLITRDNVNNALNNYSKHMNKYLTDIKSDYDKIISYINRFLAPQHKNNIVFFSDIKTTKHHSSRYDLHSLKCIYTSNFCPSRYVFHFGSDTKLAGINDSMSISAILITIGHTMNCSIVFGENRFQIRLVDVCYSVSYNDVKMILSRSLEEDYVEIFCKSGQVYLLHLPNSNSSALIKSSGGKLKLKNHMELLKKYQEKWIRKKISNFDFIIILNILSGRSFNNAELYPIFPNVMCEYTSGYPTYQYTQVTALLLSKFTPHQPYISEYFDGSLPMRLSQLMSTYKIVIPELYYSYSRIKDIELPDSYSSFFMYMYSLRKMLESQENQDVICSWIYDFFGDYISSQKYKMYPQKRLFDEKPIFAKDVSHNQAVKNSQFRYTPYKVKIFKGELFVLYNISDRFRFIFDSKEIGLDFKVIDNFEIMKNQNSYDAIFLSNYNIYAMNFETLEINHIKLDSEISRFSVSKSLMLCCCTDGSLILYNYASSKIQGYMHVSVFDIIYSDINEDSHVAAVISKDNILYIIDIINFELLSSLKIEGEVIYLSLVSKFDVITVVTSSIINNNLNKVLDYYSYYGELLYQGYILSNTAILCKFIESNSFDYIVSYDESCNLTFYESFNPKNSLALYIFTDAKISELLFDSSNKRILALTDSKVYYEIPTNMFSL